MEKNITDKNYLRDMSKELIKHLPDNHGFILLAFPFGDDPGQRLFYTSNAQRADVINMMKEFIIKNGEDEEWLKHVK